MLFRSNFKRNIYATVLKDIKTELSSKTLHELRISRDIVFQNQDIHITKSRIPNSGSNLSKSNGFRLIYIVSNNYPNIYLVDIYPKRGPLAKLNVDKNDYITVLKNMKDDKEKDALKEIDLSI